MKKNTNLKICIACSPGGHMVQARELESIYKNYEHFYFTFSGKASEILKNKYRVRTIPNIIRSNPLTWISGIILSAAIVLIEKPDVVISTGAGVTVFLCIFSKIIGAKLIFLESMAKVEYPTLTARILYPFSDLFIVQWPNLLTYFPRAVFKGRLF